jgi:hypothetical protein
MLETFPVPIRDDTIDVGYRLTRVGREFIRHEYISKKLPIKKDVVSSLREVINKNGYMDQIDLYASWVYILHDLEESATVKKYYCEWYSFDEREATKFFQTIKREVKTVDLIPLFLLSK